MTKRQEEGKGEGGKEEEEEEEEEGDDNDEDEAGGGWLVGWCLTALSVRIGYITQCPSRKLIL